MYIIEFVAVSWCSSVRVPQSVFLLALFISHSSLMSHCGAVDPSVIIVSIAPYYFCCSQCSCMQIHSTIPSVEDKTVAGDNVLQFTKIMQQLHGRNSLFL